MSKGEGVAWHGMRSSVFGWIESGIRPGIELTR